MIWSYDSNRRALRAFALLSVAVGAMSALLSVFDGNWGALGPSLMAVGWAMIAHRLA